MSLITILPIAGSYDFAGCHPEYGTGLHLSECISAIEQLPVGSRETPFYARSAGHRQYALPMQKHSGSCYVTIETSGSSSMPLSWLIPDDIRNRATRLAGNCVGEFDGIGGFEVLDLAHLVSWAVTVPPPIPPWHNPPPVGATFATITISGPSNKMFSPGNTDPAIAFAVADALATIYGENDIDLHSQRLLLDKEHYWRTVGEQMDRGGTTPWWQAAVPQASAETVYECDASLGSPSLADCSQIEWSQLGPFGKVSDSIQIEPGAPTFLHSNTCYLAISATAPLVLTWQQIRAAVATLMGICLENPYQSSQGGRAYFGSQLQQPNGRKAKAKRQNGGLLGLNALPPNANITIFRQLEPWTNPINEIETCAWQAVKIGASVMGCKVI